MTVSSRYRQWVRGRLERDAARSDGAVFGRAWLVGAVYWAVATPLLRAVLAPRDGLGLRASALSALVAGVVAWGPLQGALRLYLVRRHRRAGAPGRGPSPRGEQPGAGRPGAADRATLYDRPDGVK